MQAQGNKQNFMKPKKVEERVDREEPYQEISKTLACSWFNSNPVHCLRSRHMYKHSPPFIKYLPGKEYLQLRNEAIEAHYESFVYAPENDLIEDTKQMVSNGGKKAMEKARAGARAARSLAGAATSHIRRHASGIGSRMHHWRSTPSDQGAASECGDSDYSSSLRSGPAMGAASAASGPHAKSSVREPSPEVPESASQCAYEEAPAEHRDPRA